MKFPRIISILILALGGCVVWSGTDPDKAKKYAEIKSLPSGEHEITIHSRNYRGVWSDGFFEFQKSTYCSIKVTGDGPIYKNPDVTIMSYRQFKYSGSVSILRPQNIVKIDLLTADSPDAKENGKSFYYNGIFNIKNEK